MKLKPLADRVVLKQTEAEEKTKGGLILTSAGQEKPEVYEVIVAGPGGIVDGQEVKMTVKAGRQGPDGPLQRHDRQGGRRELHHRAPERYSGDRRVIYRRNINYG